MGGSSRVVVKISGRRFTLEGGEGKQVSPPTYTGTGEMWRKSAREIDWFQILFLKVELKTNHSKLCELESQITLK